MFLPFRYDTHSCKIVCVIRNKIQLNPFFVLFCPVRFSPFSFVICAVSIHPSFNGQNRFQIKIAKKSEFTVYIVVVVKEKVNFSNGICIPKR